MDWSGNFTGIKGYKSWKIKSSVLIVHFPPSAKYYKNGLFSLLYRRKGKDVPDKKVFTAGIKAILGFKGKHLTYIQSGANTITSEFYCFLDEIPTEAQMIKLEEYLKTA